MFIREKIMNNSNFGFPVKPMFVCKDLKSAKHLEMVFVKKNTTIWYSLNEFKFFERTDCNSILNT